MNAVNVSLRNLEVNLTGTVSDPINNMIYDYVAGCDLGSSWNELDFIVNRT
jgi:hypothetical protein